ncbi:hypothetical protein SAMN04489733_8121 [Amycolatopsis keratiniphila]|nr:hypothetical protein SAMN04489733_8121 [Amycolatopsis keratiniphila]
MTGQILHSLTQLVALDRGILHVLVCAHDLYFTAPARGFPAVLAGSLNRRRVAVRIGEPRQIRGSALDRLTPPRSPSPQAGERWPGLLALLILGEASAAL